MLRPSAAAVVSGAICGAVLGARTRSAKRGATASEERRERSSHSIYDTIISELSLAPDDLPLQSTIASTRTSVEQHLHALRSSARTASASWLQEEQHAIRTVGLLVAEDEAAASSGVSIGIATLLGSILARKRGLIIRTLTPAVCLLATGSLLLPKTTAASVGKLHDLHRRYSPRTASAVEDIKTQCLDVVGRGWSAADEGRRNLSSISDGARGQVARASQDNVESVAPTKA